MNRLSRWCAWMLLALGACLLTALPTRAASAAATLQQGPLSITPTNVTLTYCDAERAAAKRAVNGYAFSVARDGPEHQP